MGAGAGGAGGGGWGSGLGGLIPRMLPCPLLCWAQQSMLHPPWCQLDLEPPNPLCAGSCSPLPSTGCISSMVGWCGGVSHLACMFQGPGWGDKGLLHSALYRHHPEPTWGQQVPGRVCRVAAGPGTGHPPPPRLGLEHARGVGLHAHVWVLTWVSVWVPIGHRPQPRRQMRLCAPREPGFPICCAGV